MAAAAAAVPASAEVPREYPVKTEADALFAETAAILSDNIVAIPLDSSGGLAKVPSTTSATLAARIDRAVRAARIFQDHGDVTRRLLLRGLTVDYDPPTEFWEKLSELATSHVAALVKAVVPRLSAMCLKHANEPLFLLSVIDLLRYEVRRVTAELGASFQPLQAMPVAFFRTEPISVAAVVLAALRDSGSASVSLRTGILGVVLAAVDADRAQFPARHAADDPTAAALRKQIAATLTFALSLFPDTEAGFKEVFPRYVERLNATLGSFSQGLPIPQLIAETATRVQNESDRALVVLGGRRHGELRRIVQVAMLASQAERICTDPVHGIAAALAPPLPNASAFAALVLALDFDAGAVKEIGAAVERAGAAAVGRALTVATAADAATGATTSVTALPPGERRMAVVEELVRTIAAFEACIRNANVGSEALRLQFACRLRDGFRTALPRTGLEALLVETLDAMLLSAGRLGATDVERLATAARAAVAALAPYVADPALLVHSHQLRLATRLRLRPAPHVALERFVVGRLAEALGTRHLHCARTMLHDMDAVSRGAARDAASEQQGASCTPLSSYAWPAFAYPSRDSTVLHPAIESIVSTQVAAFEATTATTTNGPEEAEAVKSKAAKRQEKNASKRSGQRTARAHPVLTMVTLAAPSGGGCVRGSALQCSALLHIADASTGGITMTALASKLGVTLDEAAWVVATLAAATVVAVTHVGGTTSSGPAPATTAAAGSGLAAAAAAVVTSAATTAVSVAASLMRKRAAPPVPTTKAAQRTVASHAAAAEDDLFIAATASSSRTVAKTGLFHPDTTVAVRPAALSDGRRVLLAPLMGRQAKRSRTAVGAAGAPSTDAVASAAAAALAGPSALAAATDDALAALGAASSRQLVAGVSAVDRPFLRHFYSVAANAATCPTKDSGMGSRVPSMAPRPQIVGGGSPSEAATAVVADGHVAMVGSVMLDMARVATAVLDDDMDGAEEADEPEGSSDDEEM